MPKYLTQGRYTSEGWKGLLKEGGTKRREAVEKLVQSMGGKLEAYYFAFGDTDVYAIVDLPDNVSAAAASLAVNAGGTAPTTVVVLLTPEEVDEAVKRHPSYRPPGQ